MTKLSELLKLHEELDAMFAEHQHALLHFDFERSLYHLQRYQDALFTHMRDEEEILLPIYTERSEAKIGGGEQLFLDEHLKMRTFVELFREKIMELESDPHPEAGLIVLLDREAFYKRLCSHHDNRESEILYPELDRITSADEKVELLGRVTRAFPAAEMAN